MNRIKLIVLVACSLWMACNGSPKGHAPESADKPKEKTTEVSLTQILAEKKARFEEKAPEDKKRIYGEGIETVRNSGILEQALNVGDTAIDFSLKDAKGNEVNLYRKLEKGPVILLWYRGGWCPYCNLTLHHMQLHMPAFKERGAQILALSPELPDSTANTRAMGKLEFDVLSDLHNEVARKYGVVYRLTDEVAKRYESGVGLHAYNGDESDELPLAATYIIGRDRIIRYAFLDADYRNRADPEELLEELKEN